MFDVLIAGGGPAGLGAALMLGRAPRSVLMCDAGEPRNAVVSATHGFLSRDGMDPAALRRIGREQLRPYERVQVREVRVEAVDRNEDYFTVTLADGTQETAKKVLLAMGLVDELPPIDGLVPLWGRSVFHCPYCDGWEVRGQPLAAIGDGSGGVQLALHLTRLSHDVVLCTNGPATFDEGPRRLLASQEVSLREEPIVRLEGTNGMLERIVFGAGEPLARRALFVDAPIRQHTELPRQLGCTLLEDDAVQVDDFGQTSASGVFAAGDMARRPSMPFPFAQIAVAAASGVIAAVAIDKTLLMEELGLPGPFPPPG